jgi:hypothetical protein
MIQVQPLNTQSIETAEIDLNNNQSNTAIEEVLEHIYSQTFPDDILKTISKQ